MNTTELKAPDSDCPYCNGTGEADSGGTHPWGAPATIPCRCMYEDPFHVHVSAYNNIAAQLDDAQGEIRALRATEAGLRESLSELVEAADSMRGTYTFQQGKTPEHEDHYGHEAWAGEFLHERAEAARALLEQKP